MFSSWVRLLGKFRGEPEKVRWIVIGVLVEGMRDLPKDRRARRTQRQNDNAGIPFHTNTILFSALRYRRTAMPFITNLMPFITNLMWLTVCGRETRSEYLDSRLHPSQHFRCCTCRSPWIYGSRLRRQLRLIMWSRRRAADADEMSAGSHTW